jgi:phosphatidylinositol 4-kinase
MNDLFLGLPSTEKFSFCLNTLLSDISVCCPNRREEIIQTQVEVFATLTNIIISKQNTSSATLCKDTIPILLGLSRAIGRYAIKDPALICRMYPAPEKPDVKSTNLEQAMLNDRQKFSPNFRPIIPRSMSGSLNIEAIEAKKGSITPSASPRKSEPTASRKLFSYYSVPYDPTRYFFTKFGSSFNQFPNMRSFEHDDDIESQIKREKIQFPINHLQQIFAFAKKLLAKEILEYLDEKAEDVFSMLQNKTFGYRSFAETINLVIVTLLRELLQNQTDLSTPFTKDIQEFVKQLFLNGQTEINNKQHEDHKKNDNELNIVNKYKINVMANAACVDLLVWAIRDETGELGSHSVNYMSLCYNTSITSMYTIYITAEENYDILSLHQDLSKLLCLGR